MKPVEVSGIKGKRINDEGKEKDSWSLEENSNLAGEKRLIEGNMGRTNMTVYGPASTLRPRDLSPSSPISALYLYTHRRTVRHSFLNVFAT